MPGPYRRLDVPNVNQHVVTAPVEKSSKRKAAAAKPTTKAEDAGLGAAANVVAKAVEDDSKAAKADTEAKKK